MNFQSNISFKNKLKKGGFVVGTWCEIPSPELINVLAKAGLDFVIIDMEHGTMDYTMAGRMVIAAEVEGCNPLIRVPRNDRSNILRALEVSPKGIIVPHIETVLDRENAINFIKFPPKGKRSLNPYTRSGGYRVVKGSTKDQNNEILSCLMIEGEKGISSAEEIIDNSEVDLIYIGTYDISLALGVPGDTKNPRVIKILEELTELIRKKNKIVGCLFHTEEEFKFFKKIGIQFLCYKVDTGVIFNAFRRSQFK